MFVQFAFREEFLIITLLGPLLNVTLNTCSDCPSRLKFGVVWREVKHTAGAIVDTGRKLNRINSTENLFLGAGDELSALVEEFRLDVDWNERRMEDGDAQHFDGVRSEDGGSNEHVAALLIE